MSDYTKITDFAAKDSMLSGNPLKEITGTAHDDEYNAIQYAVSTKVDKNGALGTPASGTLTNCTGLTTSGIVDGSITTAKFDASAVCPNATTISGTTQSAAITWSAKQTFGDTVKLDEVLERVTITASAPTGTFDCLTQGIQYFTSNTSANWTQNFRGDGSNTLNSIMAVGESITVTVLATNSTTGYLPTTIQVDGSTVTAKYLGGTAWTEDASCINAFTFTIIKTASATFTVLASKSKYA